MPLFDPADLDSNPEMLFWDINSILDASRDHFSPGLAGRGPADGDVLGGLEPVLESQLDEPEWPDEMANQRYAPTSHYDSEPAARLGSSGARSLPLNMNSPSLDSDAAGSLFTFYEQPEMGQDSPERIALFFDRRTSKVLCIKEMPTGNPWREIVWPLAKDHPALYHAIAAMTCFNSRFRAEGFRHLDSSIQKFAVGSMPLEVALVVTLALSLAQTWYYPRSSNGITYIRKAKDLLRQAQSESLASRPLEGNLSMSFLANTLIYMDVLTRVTRRSDQTAAGEPDPLVSTTWTLQGAVAGPEHQIDPLMGCAVTLFPLIGRVADLVGHVRRTPRRKANALAVVSQAVELMANIEGWAPPQGLDAVPDTGSLTSSASDLVQTAEAYKWATLLLLYQAVPELPSRLSYAEIAQKVLVFIATVPLGSRAAIFAVLPLMIAGCEATEAEDRDWIRNRWQSLTSDNGSGIVDRCLELTLEVWRRRDSNENRCESCRSPRNKVGSLAVSPGQVAGSTPTGHGEPTAACGRKKSCLCSHGDGKSSTAPTLSNSTKHVNEAGKGEEYTVKSKLHWLSVMEEWGWEGEANAPLSRSCSLLFPRRC